MFRVPPGAVHHHPRARFVRILEGNLDALQQLVGARAVSGKQAHPARQAQIEAHLGEMKAAADDREELLGVEQRALRGAAGREHQELSLAESRHGVVGGGVVLEPAGGLAQHLIADLVSEGGVDVAEVAQLDQQQRRSRLPRPAAEEPLEGALEERAVG